MRKVLIILILNLLLGSVAIAQTLTSEEIKGRWSVVRVLEFIEESGDSEQGNAFEDMRAAFLEAEYVFGDNNQFALIMDYKQFAIENGYWVYDELEKKVSIREWKKNKQKPGKSIMKIKLEKAGDKIILIMDTTGIVFQIEKKA
ncbi:hypothetical protein [Labilibacter marinus]|uniref:hypothetical protein n=1 Tax=Labilibacter marinus TaxID=1477105 RepID=UPI00082954EF|nr:hypothetical protein [Labilibacter marinus]